MTRAHVDFYLREILTAGMSQIGYVRAYVHGLIGDGQSYNAVNGGNQFLADLRPRALEFMGPFQRMAIHVDSLERFRTSYAADEEPSAHLGRLLSEELRRRQVQCALFSDPTLLARTFARWHLRRSVTLVLFPESADLVVEYGMLLEPADTGAAILVVDSAGERAIAGSLLRVGMDSTFLGVLSTRGVPADSARLYQVRAAGVARPVFVFAFRDRLDVEGNKSYCEACRDIIVQEWQRFSRSTVTTPALAVAPGAALDANCVSDGSNSFRRCRGRRAAPRRHGRWTSRRTPSVVAGFTAE